MPNFSTAHDQSFEALEATFRLRTKLNRQLREGAHNQGDREAQRVAHNIAVMLGALADSLVVVAELTQTLAQDQVGDVTTGQLSGVAGQIREIAQKLPDAPQ